MSAVDWATVAALRARVTDGIEAELDSRSASARTLLTEQDTALLGRAVATRVVREHSRQWHREGAAWWEVASEETYVNAVLASIFGYGRLQPLFEIPEAENIEVNGWDHICAQYPSGRRVEMAPVTSSDAELVEAIRFLGERARPSRPFDDAHPTMTLALGDRFRLHAIGFGLVHRPSVTIRQHRMLEVTLTGLAADGMMPAELAELLAAAVRAGLSIVVSGDQGAGKTTLLRALIDAIPDGERFGTLETDYELLTHLQERRRSVVAMQARVGLGEMVGSHRVGDVGLSDLVPEALRQNLSRLVVGEVRGGEAAAMFEAMQSGTGTMSTTHAPSAASTVDRLAARIATGGVMGIDEALRQIAHHLALLVHVQVVGHGSDRRRVVAEVRHVTGGLEGGRPVTHLVHEWRRGQVSPGDLLAGLLQDHGQVAA